MLDRNSSSGVACLWQKTSHRNSTPAESHNQNSNDLIISAVAPKRSSVCSNISMDYFFYKHVTPLESSLSYISAITIVVLRNVIMNTHYNAKSVKH